MSREYGYGMLVNSINDKRKRELRCNGSCISEMYF